MPIAQNEPWLGSALALVAGLIDGLTERGFPAERLAVMGFFTGRKPMSGPRP